MQADSLPAEPQGKPKNTGVGSLSLLRADLPDPGIDPGSPALQVDYLPTELCWEDSELPSKQIKRSNVSQIICENHKQT